MEKVIIKKNKVILTIPAYSGNKLREEIERVVTEWTGYNTPHLVELGNNRLEVGLDGKVVKAMNKITKEGICIFCGTPVKGEITFAATGSSLKEQRLIMAVVCRNCHYILQDVFNKLHEYKGRIKVKIFAGGKRKLKIKDTCPECGYTVEIDGNNIIWSNKSSWRSCGSLGKEIELRIDDKVKIKGGKDICKLVGGPFIEPKWNVQTDKGTQTIAESQLEFYAKKLKPPSEKELKKLNRKLKKAGLTI